MSVVLLEEMQIVYNALEQNFAFRLPIVLMEYKKKTKKK